MFGWISEFYAPRPASLRSTVAQGMDNPSNLLRRFMNNLLS